jgi:DNA polymerase III epsilon subunit-like protein
MDRPIVVLDTERAAPHGAPHLIEIGAVRVVEGEALEHFSRLVRPEVPLDPQTELLCGIDERELAAAEDAGRVLSAFVAWVGDDWLAAHRAEADLRVLAFEAARHDVALPASPCLDTLTLARRALPEAPDHRLATLVEHLGIEVERRHRALDDAVACWQVLEACARRLEPERVPRAAELLARAGRPLSLPAAAPRTPRLAPRLRPLEEAARARRPLELLYGAPEGGPPAWLGIVPRLLYAQGAHGYLEAECRRSGMLKTYRLDRVQRVKG